MVMNIVYMDKDICWDTSKGVVLGISVKLTTRDGTWVIDIQIYGNGSIPLITITTADKYFLLPTAVIHEWVKVEGYMQEWEVAVAKYRRALSRIDLPCRPVYNRTSNTGSGYLSLIYRLSMGTASYCIDIEVETYSEVAKVSITLNKQHAYGMDHLHVDTVTTTDIVTMDSLRALVKASLNNFIGSLQGVSTQVIVPEIGTANVQH
jgi:hypothetical protein